MYVTPPDMDVYSIPKVLAPMPQKVLSDTYFYLIDGYACCDYYSLFELWFWPVV